MTVPSHLQTTQTARKLHQTVSKDIVLYQKVLQAVPSHKLPLQTSSCQGGQRSNTKRAQTSTSSNPKHSKNENYLKKQALGEPYAVHVRCTLLFTSQDIVVICRLTPILLREQHSANTLRLNWTQPGTTTSWGHSSLEKLHLPDSREKESLTICNC